MSMLTPPSDKVTAFCGRKRSGSPLDAKDSKRSDSSMSAAVDIDRLPADLILPRLPVIGDPAIERRVFTHSSMVAASKSSVRFMEEKEALVDNEKMEWVGDGILKMVCTRLLQRLWPNMREGPTTTIMGHLVSNAILAQLTERYKLMDRLRADPNQAMSIKASEKNRANLFEAYLCGVYESHLSTSSGTPKTDGEALDELSRWLIPVFEPIAQYLQATLRNEQQRLARRSRADNGDDDVDPNLVKGCAARLNEVFTSKHGALPIYEYAMGEGLLWVTKCTAKLRDGTLKTAETVQTGKKAGMNVAAYKLLVALKIEDRIV